MEINVLVFESPPESLYEYIVLTAASTIHADGHVVILKNLGERFTGKLSPLVSIEDFRCTITAQRFFKGFYTKGSSQRVGDPPG